MDSNEIWNEFLSKIKTKVSLMSYNYLFKDLKLYSYENSKMIKVMKRAVVKPQVSVEEGVLNFEFNLKN